MFTGLIEELGTIVDIRVDAVSAQTILTIAAEKVLEAVTLGDSIATNGVCLTVTAFDHQKKQFTVGLSAETLKRTSFKGLKKNDRVNLERSLTANGKIGGHFVQGHVDCTGTILSKVVDVDMLVVTVQLDREFALYIVEKGYISIDGTSLTVTAVHDLDNTNSSSNPQSTFSVMLVQYTQNKIVLPLKAVGESVNLEVDILGKYFVRFMENFQKQQLLTNSKKQQQSKLAKNSVKSDSSSELHTQFNDNNTSSSPLIGMTGNNNSNSYVSSMTPANICNRDISSNSGVGSSSYVNADPSQVLADLDDFMQL